MTGEHETTLEVMGEQRPAIIRYELDPTDGYPCIEAVEVGRAIVGEGYVEHMAVDLLPILDEADRLRLELIVCEARPLWREEAA